MSSFPLADRAETRHILTFRLGGKRRGVPADRVLRVAEIHHYSPLPSDLRCNLGLVTHRGVIAGLVNLELLEWLNPAVRQGRKDAPISSDSVFSENSQWPFSSLPFLCIFAKFPRGVAGFPIEELLALETYTWDPESGDDENPMLDIEMIDLDALEVFA